jgi:hypothetical protein
MRPVPYSLRDLHRIAYILHRETWNEGELKGYPSPFNPFIHRGFSALVKRMIPSWNFIKYCVKFGLIFHLDVICSLQQSLLKTPFIGILALKDPPPILIV